MKYMIDKLLSLRKVGCEVVIAQWSRQITKLAITRYNILYEQITTSENISRLNARQKTENALLNYFLTIYR